MNKFGAFLIALTIAATIGTIAVGFKVKNLLFGFIVGFLAIIGLVFIGNILRIAKELSNIFKETRSMITLIILYLYFNCYNYS